ncbi:MAG: hypothetical protein H7346_03320 [Burkholderiaceae bacterium]|nr:hypothetical protein [Burkholderiaceae bacterium]
MQSFEVRFLAGLLQRLRLRGVSIAQGRPAHFQAIPLLSTPAKALGIQDAGARSTAAFIFLHNQAQTGVNKVKGRPDKPACAGNPAAGQILSESAFHRAVEGH